MAEKREKPTVQLCFFRHENGNICTNSPTWKIEGKFKKFRVCDIHLAWGIRFSGYPALVDKHIDKHNFGLVKEEIFDPSQRKEYSQQVDDSQQLDDSKKNIVLKNHPKNR